MAGALGVRLGGRNVYFGRSEVRPFLGDGPRPEARHLKRAARISRAVGLAALGLAVAAAPVAGRLTVLGGRGVAGAARAAGRGAVIAGRAAGRRVVVAGRAGR